MRETIQNANGKQFHAVSLSGGKDSTAMLLLMIERGMPIDMVLSADTGMEFPEMYEHLAKLDEHLFRERGISVPAFSLQIGGKERDKSCRKKLNRESYVAYRKAGYSKKILAEHESEITIHKAAKNYFDGLGFKKLPTIKALNTEYAELLAEKKAAYADYRKAREEMKELLTAKANIDRILELDKEQEEANERREKEAEQR